MKHEKKILCLRNILPPLTFSKQASVWKKKMGKRREQTMRQSGVVRNGVTSAHRFTDLKKKSHKNVMTRIF